MTIPQINAAQVDVDSLYTFDGSPGWGDILGPFTGAKTTAATDPAWAVFRNGVYTYSFSQNTMNELWLQFHLPHDYVAGTVIYPHIHWSTAGTNTGVVRWGFEYTAAKGYSQEAFPATTTAYVEQAATGTAYTHMIGEVSLADAIPTTHLEPDSIIMVRVFRDAAHANDTCTDAAFGFMCDLHYQKSGISTKNRNYPFS